MTCNDAEKGDQVSLVTNMPQYLARDIDEVILPYETHDEHPVPHQKPTIEK